MSAGRVAALYDVHGNLPALEAVLAEADALGADLVVVGGDVVWGPLPRETLERLQELGERALFVRGNADREVAARDVSGAEGVLAEVTLWCADQLSSEQLGFLGALPTTVSVDLDGLGPTLFCHGSPRSDEEKITSATSESRLVNMLAGTAEEVVVCGHTHAQFERRIARWRVVNSGSVGMQFGERGAYWALLGPDVDLRHTPYDVEAAAERIRHSPCPDAAGFAAHLLSPPPADMAARVFGDE